MIKDYAYRTVDGWIKNESGGKLTLVSHTMPWGRFLNDIPIPDELKTIDNGKWASFVVETAIYLSGCEGSLTYQIENDPTRTWTAYWYNPYCGTNKFTQKRDPPDPKIPDQQAKQTNNDRMRVVVEYTCYGPGDTTGPSDKAGPPPSTQNATHDCGTATAHISSPAGERTAMICPEGNVAALRAKILNGPKLFVNEDNRVWAEQWMDHDAEHRKLWFLRETSTLDDFVSAAKEAASWAQGGEVILFVGHGAAAGHRGAAFTAFDTVPEQHGAAENFSKHKHVVGSYVLTIEQMATKTDKGWVWTQSKPLPAPETLENITHKWEKLGELGEAFESARLGLFTVLACMVASDGEDFGERLARRLRCAVRLYRSLVATTADVVESSTVKGVPAKRTPHELIYMCPEMGECPAPPSVGNLEAIGNYEVPNYDYIIWDAQGKQCG